MSITEHGTRTEHDFLGSVEVPLEALYGAQTVRALHNFSISQRTLSDYPALVRSLALVKKAAAQANADLGNVPAPIAALLLKACDEIIDGQHREQFPLDMLQGGAGTSSNMNMNEVVANRALQLGGYALASYNIIHPNDHVNCSQSTNDVYPTALRLAIRSSSQELIKALGEMVAVVREKAQEFKDIVKLGRTQLQDAVPMTLGQEFNAFATSLQEEIDSSGFYEQALKKVNIGGTAIGTGILASTEFRKSIIANLNAAGADVEPAQDLIAASWDTSAFVSYSGMLKRIAVKLSKISNDLRLLSSGPRGGLGEIHLPAVQAGSSIMPGKVNPVIPEVVSQVAFQVIGQDVTVSMAAEAGQLQLNAMEPVIIYNILSSIQLLTNAVNTLTLNCLQGVTANTIECSRHLEKSTANATSLIPAIGYDAASRLAKKCLATGIPVSELYLQEQRLT